MRRASLLCLTLLAVPMAASAATRLSIEPDPASLSGHPLRLTLEISETAEGEAVEVRLLIEGREVDRRELGDGEHQLQLDGAKLEPGRYHLQAEADGAKAETYARVIPGWLALLPPLIAIALALAFKDVLLSLFVGVFAGALILFDWNPVTALARSIDHFIAASLADADQAKIVIFTALLGGMVGLISKSGGTQGIVERLRVYATNSRRGQVATWILGVLIFFDDYANTLIVGSTMRPITDRLKVSREKLAYIVDSTAAPVASVMPISSWIGFEVGLIAAAFTALELPYNAYATFVASIPYRFYPLLALVLGFTIAITGRDLGPMLRAERRAQSTGKLLADGALPLASYDAKRLAPPEGAPRRALNAFIPILTVIVVALAGMYRSGSRGLDRSAVDSSLAWLREVFGNADSIAALLWASLAGLLMAAVLPLAQRILSLRQSMEAAVEGFKSMLLALMVLVLAWSIGSVCAELHTADYVVGAAQQILSPHLLPVVVFVLSAAVAFATGSSWGTLAILMPLVVPIANGLATDAGMAVGSAAYSTILIGTISSVLAGSVWGDHCSPISDTTILSSTASACDHIAHVRTQMPYALAVGLLAIAIGDLPSAYGLHPVISLLAGTVVIVAGVLWLGQRSEPLTSPKAVEG